MNNSGTLVIAPIRPQGAADSYPTAFANEIAGGWHIVETLSARDAIPEERRIIGMAVNVISEGMVFTLTGGITNSDWSETSINAGLFRFGSVRHRQALLEYPKNATGDPNFITTIGLSATAIGPIVGAIMANADIKSERYLPVTIPITVENAWVVTQNSTTYLYCEINLTNGSVIFGATTNTYTDSYIEPLSPVLGDHWIDRLNHRIVSWNGSVWVQVYRLFVAKLISNTSNITSIQYLTDNEELAAARKAAFITSLIF